MSISSSILFDLKEAKTEYDRLFCLDYLSHPELPLFPSSQKQATKFVPLAYSTYQNTIKKLIRAIGLNPDLYGTHSLRSAVPLEFFEKEGDIVTTSHMFGHRSTATTQIYVEEVAKKKASEMRTKYNFSD